LCRELGVIHPDVLFERLTTAQFFEWWTLYNDEPFGDTRADLRAWAHVCLGLGAKGIQLVWPYIEEGWTPEEIESETERIEQALQDAINRTKGRHDGAA
jgi:hypothetical protein